MSHGTVIGTSVATVVVCNALGKVIDMINESNKPKTKVHHPSYGYWIQDRENNFKPTGVYL